MKRCLFFCILLVISLTAWTTNKNNTYSNISPNTDNSQKIIGLWNFSEIEDGLEYNCILGFSVNHAVGIIIWSESFDPNIGSFKLIIEEQGYYKILENDTLITCWNSNTAKITIADLQFTDALTALIKERPEIENKIHETIENLCTKKLKDIAGDILLLYNRIAIQSISDRELVIGDSRKTYYLKKEK